MIDWQGLKQNAYKGIKNINLSAVGGPCLAAELANRVQSGVVIASKNLDTAISLKKMLTTKYYRISTSTDINGVEACAAIKNIFIEQFPNVSEALSWKSHEWSEKELQEMQWDEFRGFHLKPDEGAHEWHKQTSIRQTQAALRPFNA